MSYSPSSSIPSSPASSPSLGPLDSSPPSSPNINARHLSEDPESPLGSPGLAHPFAGSSKAVKKFRLYEKREQRWGADLNDDVFVDGTDEDGSAKYGGFDASATACISSDTEVDDFFADDDFEGTAVEEHDLWERMLSEAIDQGNGLIDLRYVLSRHTTNKCPLCLYRLQFHIVWRRHNFYPSVHS